MSILNITHLTDTPYQDMVNKYRSAYDYLINEDEDLKNAQGYIDFNIDDFARENIDSFIELCEEATGSEILSLVDNRLVNHDYVDEVREHIYTNLI